MWYYNNNNNNKNLEDNIMENNLDLGTEMFDIPEEKQEEFKVCSDKAAEWALKKIKAHEIEARRFQSVCNEMIADYQMKIAASNKSLENNISWLNSKLIEYFEYVEKKKTLTQETYKLPTGVLKRKFGAIDYKKDDIELVKFLKNNKLDKYIKTTEVADWKEFKADMVGEISGEKVLTKDGEIIEGLKATIKDDKFSIDFK